MLPVLNLELTYSKWRTRANDLCYCYFVEMYPNFLALAGHSTTLFFIHWINNVIVVQYSGYPQMMFTSKQWMRLNLTSIFWIVLKSSVFSVVIKRMTVLDTEPAPVWIWVCSQPLIGVKDLHIHLTAQTLI